MKNQQHIAIVGGGPVGLYLAGRLLQHGFRCTLLEKRRQIDRHSKSLGIHPVSLELFEQAGVSKPFLEQGLRIKKGHAFWNLEKIGKISFENCPKPFNFILALPQWKTETILEQWVQSLDSTTLIRGAELITLSQTKDSVTLTYQKNNEEKTINTDFAVGCDGKNSWVRRLLDIPYNGKPYPDKYVMGDFTDNTEFGTDAAVYLYREGLIESFPLPDGMRRWVVKTDLLIDTPEPDMIHKLIKERIGHSLASTKNLMISSFGAHHYLAETFCRGRVLLAGDAAHVVSPIGGQGMNLGWLGAELCADTLLNLSRSQNNHTPLFEKYSRNQRKIAKQIAKRAELNMWLGRKENSGLFVKLAARFITIRPFSRYFAKLFTMRGLGKWWI